MNPADTSQASEQRTLVSTLLDRTCYPHAVDRVELLETHISYVLLAGAYAYKIKKAVDLGFLDFTTLQKRHHYCQEELRLNRRLAPSIYADVIPIAGSPTRPVLGGNGAAIEYAVKMRRFGQDDLFNSMLARGRMTAEHIDQLAAKIAAFHDAASVASLNDAYGTPDAIRRPALENFAQIRDTPAAARNRTDLETLEKWTVRECDELAHDTEARKRHGFVRECHGDFHLGNIALVDGEVTAFDCLEFSANLRWIDVMNEIAFLVMDLRDRNRPDFARRFLNRYLEITGDYAGLPLLRFYAVYRAMVRAKVHALRACAARITAAQRAAALDEYCSYVSLARRQSADARAALIITHGLSGSGKTTHTQVLLEMIDAVRVRSDIERKRNDRLPPLARSGSAIATGLYTAEASTRTYDRLLALADSIVKARYTAIVDATFLERGRRDAFRRLAASLGVPFLILDFTAPDAVLRKRVRRRQEQRRDASEADVAVLQYQLEVQEPLRADERALSVEIDTTRQRDMQTWSAVLASLGLDMR